MDVDISRWSGEGTFTQRVVERLRELERVAFVRVEDAPATRSDADYNFVSNEIYVAFISIVRLDRIRRFGIWPATRTTVEKAMTLFDLEAALTLSADVGAPDYSDERMLQYLKTERVIPPYQTRGYKLVELVRIYEVDAPPAPSIDALASDRH
jgi:hypothetical protein